ncbi:MAG TPA: FHA domain-containing protein, partial [Caulifigura sp.]|nr:FHA domain-containing protein [Caulifigura sp.]
MAHGPDPSQRLRHALDAGQPQRLGRSSEVELPVPWEPVLSRDHLTLTANTTAVHLSRRSSAANPVFVSGKAVDEASLAAGDTFV